MVSPELYDLKKFESIVAKIIKLLNFI